MDTYNGMPAVSLAGARWRKSSVSDPTGSAIEVASLDGQEFAVRNSRHPEGPALIYTRAEMVALVAGVKDGEFDDLLEGAG